MVCYIGSQGTNDQLLINDGLILFLFIGLLFPQLAINLLLAFTEWRKEMLGVVVKMSSERIDRKQQLIKVDIERILSH